MISVIPRPEHIEELDSTFIINADTEIYVSDKFCALADFVRDILRYDFAESDKANVRFEYTEALEAGHYDLSVTPSGISAYASDFTGAFYALQTLRQMFEADGCRGAFLCSPCAIIKNDGPRFSWRGLELDESRHFFGKECVKKLLDSMAMYKLNMFHWHLTDDQGWRIEIKKYPLLTEIGSKRKGTHLHSWGHCEVDYTPYEGFYTQDDIKEIVDYAAQRSITIIPEIDFPAHSAAVLAAYKQFACREKETSVLWYFGGIIPEKAGINDWNRPLCLGKEEVYNFAFDVFDEIARLFPAKFIHVGGDEAPTEEWEKCPECQKMMKANGLSNERELQAYFTNKLAEHLKTLGKDLIGWNEILKGNNISRDVVAQYWTSTPDKNVIGHLEQGGRVLLSKHQAFYFDMPYWQTSMKSCYNFEYHSLGIDKKFESQLLGVEAELWSEWLENFERVEFNLFPRILALSETAWSAPSVKNWGSFKQRALVHMDWFKRMGIVCAPAEIAFKRNLAWKKLRGKELDFKSFSFEYDLAKRLI